MRFKPKAWILVLSGVILTVVSALLSHYVVAGNMREISALEAKNTQLQGTIESFWQNSQSYENKVNTALIVLASSHDKRLASQLVRETIASSGVEYKLDNKAITPEFLLNTARVYQAGIINKINDLYTEQIDISDKIMKIEMKSADYVNLALFLQIFGLILVLARDLGVRGK